MLQPDQARIRSFRVVPALPEPLAPLLEIAHNFWWTWRPEAASLFRRLDRELWRKTWHNPVKLLGQVSQDVLDRAAADQSYLHALSHTQAHLRSHLEGGAWFQRAHPDLADGVRDPGAPNACSIAYFSAEFGLAECFQIYSGGLGCLSGDHLKSASELGLPLVAVGLLYRCGYFHQYLNAEGWQQETYPDIDFPNQPIHRVLDVETGRPVQVTVELPGRNVVAGVWRASVGRIPLFLLDTNLPDNTPEDREITRNLYGGDIETRIRQEIVLGIGGVRALDRMGYKPTVYHLNEGHSAFLALERVRLIQKSSGATFEEAREAAAAQNLFTTHTPVPAGIDRFAPELIDRYLTPMRESLGLDRSSFLALGRENVFDEKEFFSMAVLAIRTSRFCNGVSRLHGDVSRSMWKHIWPGLPEGEAPIGHITNGVHARTWIAPDLMALFDRYLGSAWMEDPSDHSVWQRVADIPDEELWRVRERMREDMIAWVQRRIRAQLAHRGAGPEEIDAAAGALDPRALTIGFARRFATYKRGSLLLHDRQRLTALLESDDRPIQFLIAGKAHPADAAGKEYIRELVNFAHEGGRALRVVFLEDYDIAVGRKLVRGCDVWLNTPRRGLEASGTSGMKAAMNGCVNLSILDGWWDEAYEPSLGFAIGRGESYADHAQADYVESRALYDLLERQILPEFYDRSLAGVPRKWLGRVKRCIRKLAPQFNTNRMVAEYTDRYYIPAHGAGRRLHADELLKARELATQIARLRRHWPAVSVESAEAPVSSPVPVRTPVPITTTVRLGELTPEEVTVQLYHGEVTSAGSLVGGLAVDLRHQTDLGGGRHTFVGEFQPRSSGRCGYAVRVLPRDERFVHPYVPGLITWQTEEHAKTHAAHRDGHAQVAAR